MADEADKKEETTEAETAPGEITPAGESSADAAVAGDATPAKKRAAAKKPAAKKKAATKKAPAAKSSAKPAAQPVGRKVPLKKLDVKNLADELKLPSEKEEERKNAPAPAAKKEDRPTVVKAVPVKPGGGKGVAAKRTSLDESAGPAASGSSYLRRVSHRNVTDFLRQLIMLLRAGTPILKALQTLSKRSSNRATRALISDITQRVEAGNPLWHAFDGHSRHFDRVFVNLIRASEASGTLVTVLGRLVAYRTKRELLGKRIRGALIYPVILVFACTAVLLLLTWWVVPQFKEIFDKAGIETSPLTNTVFSVSEWFARYWWTPYALILGIVILYAIAVKNSPAAKMLFDRVKISLPIVGEILHKGALVQLTRTMALLIRSGVSMMQTLELTRSSVSNLYVGDALKDVRDSIERGGGMEGPLRKKPRAIPPVMTDMLVTGEDSGRVDDVADQIAEIYEEEVEIKTQMLGEALQPVFTVIVGIVVMILFIALFLPLITSMDQLAGSAGV